MDKEDYLDIYFLITFALCFMGGSLGLQRFFNGQFKTGLLILYLTNLFPIANYVIFIELIFILTGVLKIER